MQVEGDILVFEGMEKLELNAEKAQGVSGEGGAGQREDVESVGSIAVPKSGKSVDRK